MPPKINREKTAKFKNRYVEKDPAVEKRLPDDLRGLYSQRKYQEFLENALEKLELLEILQKIYPTLLSDLSDKQEVHELLENIDCTYKKLKTYLKSGQHKYVRAQNVINAGNRLPADLKELFFNGKRKVFLKKALQIFASNFELLDCLLEICPTFAFSKDKNVHELVQQFFYDYAYENVDDFIDSRYIYICQVEDTRFLPEDWVDEYHSDLEEIIEQSKAVEAGSLADLKKQLRGNDVLHVKNLTFKVESKFKKKCQETSEPQNGSLLFEAAAEFESTLKIWFKLDGKFRKLPGVYFLYYIGDDELYTGSGIIGSQNDPLYIGMSISDISARLKDHHAKIMAAKDLDVVDFAVKVMFVDNRHYAPCIEGMFIEHFAPIWNKETLGICFGAGANSLWKKVHVDKAPESIGIVLEQLKIHSDDSESDSDSDIIED